MGNCAFRQGIVIETIKKQDGLTEATVEMGGNKIPAVNYDFMTGGVEAGDYVILNTTAVDLELGTGGTHFILWNLSRKDFIPALHGHIIKLRYTPLQMACLAAEEQHSPHHELLKDKTSIEGMAVVIGELHSQLPAVCVTIKELNPDFRVSYIMTDGGALPITFSKLIAELKEKSLIDGTITIGNAFGGDMEAINIYSGLTAAQAVLKADITVVMMGPGVAGTDTILGFSGIEQGTIINAVNSLGGTAIAIPRLSFQDKRERHYGVSHHSLTALSLIALSPATVVLPSMEEWKVKIVEAQFRKYNIYSKHKVKTVANNITLNALKKRDIKVSTMGRSIELEPDFFQAAGAAGIVATQIVKK